MKGKIILYGWVFSIILMVIGLGLIEWALETGDPVMLPGLALFLVWVIFGLLIIKYPNEVNTEAKKFDRWFDRSMEKINRFFGID